MDIIKIIIIVSASLYFIASVLYIFKQNTIGHIIHGLAFIVNAGLVIVNMVHNGYVPFISMYQVLTFASVCFSITYLYMHYVKDSKWMVKYFTLCAGFVMVGSFFNYTTLTWYRPPALQSIWFIPHVLLYMIGYPLCAVSFVICIMRLVLNKGDKQLRDKGIYDVIQFSFPFMTAGMFLGAIWANEIWGHYWSWDAKENWALITWLLYAIYLHCYRTEKLRKIMYVFALLGFVALLMTLFGINIFINSSPHLYS